MARLASLSVWVRLQVSTRNLNPSPWLQVLQAPWICATCWLWPGGQSFCFVFAWWAPRVGLSCYHLCLTSGTQELLVLVAFTWTPGWLRKALSQPVLFPESTDEVASGLARAKSLSRVPIWGRAKALVPSVSPLHIQQASPPFLWGANLPHSKTMVYLKDHTLDMLIRACRHPISFIQVWLSRSMSHSIKGGSEAWS